MLQKFTTLFFLIATISLSTGCSKKEKDLAGVKHFYFEFIDNVQTDLSTSVIEGVSKDMPTYDYLMSEESAARGWPFYGTVKRGSKVLKTDMMPPHTNVNRLSPIINLDAYNEGEHTMKVVFVIEKYEDSLLTISKQSFEWSGDEWRNYSMKRFTDFNTKDMDQPELVEKISKTLIRYTFK